jgi:hypothetical protein
MFGECFMVMKDWSMSALLRNRWIFDSLSLEDSVFFIQYFNIKS